MLRIGESESTRMVFIYKNAVCNLCASVPTSSSNGFSVPERIPDPSLPTGRFNQSRSQHVQMITEKCPWEFLREAPLYHRVWVLQGQTLVGLPVMDHLPS
jgi:hypothetical protein